MHSVLFYTALRRLQGEGETVERLATAMHSDRGAGTIIEVCSKAEIFSSWMMNLNDCFAGRFGHSCARRNEI